jgi:hypothetical protein
VHRGDRELSGDLRRRIRDRHEPTLCTSVEQVGGNPGTAAYRVPGPGPMLPRGRNGQPSHPSGQSTLDALTHRHGEQLKALAAASVRIAAATSPDATLQQITEEARRIVGAHLAATHRVSHANWKGASVAVSLSEKYHRFASFSTPPNGSGIYRRAIHGGDPLRLSASELTAHPDWRGLSGYKADHPPLRGLLAVPITDRDGKSVGVIMLSDKEDGLHSRGRGHSGSACSDCLGVYQECSGYTRSA